MAVLGGGAAMLLLAGTVCLTSGCSTFGYIGQSIGGHLDLMQRARPVDQWLAEDATAQPLRRKLSLSQEMRAFAVRELKLPDNASYTRYADIGRPAVVWNVVATPDLSLKLKTWCFPVMGCVGYRGYFQRADADALAAELRASGLEVNVYGVPAYSTLGWTNWLGGDPLLSTFIGWPDGEVARLMFHELAHQVVYASDDTAFNESFAVSVERLGGNRWLAQHADAQAIRDFQATQQRREAFRALTLRARTALAALYREADLDDDAKRRRKTEVFAQMRVEYARLKADQWGGYAGYDNFIANANNASLAVQGAYNDLVPHFERLFDDNGRDFNRFYDAVKRLAALPKDERHAKLRAP